jgi:hypothetical protein
VKLPKRVPEPLFLIDSDFVNWPVFPPEGGNINDFVESDNLPPGAGGEPIA